MNVIEVKNFKKSFSGKPVHKDVTFSVKKGECLALVGGSGVGKSVILRSLIGLEKPDSGQIIIEGQDITPLNERELVSVRKKVAYVFQGGALFDSMTVFENLAYPLREHTNLKPKEISEKVMAQLEEFGMASSKTLMPAQLSGGMQKRVGLARAMLLNPDVILYDEPTAGLDPYNTHRIQEIALRLKDKGVTSVLVTHDMPTAFAVCDRFGLLAEGKIFLEDKNTDRLKKFIDGESE